ncbi:MAG: hypothetical protein K0R26_387 [Bacteroidota bacterium]|jgi:hypothetical protein|nr:hypothetical protein [Bacteroidota bacterium]
MIKNLLIGALMFSGVCLNAQTTQTFTATFDFAATTSVTGTTDPTPLPMVTGLTFTPFTAVGTPSANPNATGRFSFVGWPLGATPSVDTYSTMTGSINTGEYYEVTLTPQSGFTLGLNSIGFTVQRSGAGIRSYAVRTSVDGFAMNLPASVTTNTNLSVVGSNEFFWNFDATTSAQNGSTINLFGATTTSSVSFRFYGWNAEQSGGTFSIDNVVFNGFMSSMTTGIKHFSTEGLMIYPNPNNGIFTVNAPSFPSIVNAFDVNGKLVASQTLSSKENVIDFSNLSNGVYHITISTGVNTLNQKLVISK